MLKGASGVAMPEWFIWKAAKILKCSYLELFYHRDRNQLMSTAFTLQMAQSGIEEVLKADTETKAKLKNAA